MEKLVAFYCKVHPPGYWKPVAEIAGLLVKPINWQWILGWIGGVALIYGGLIALGGLLLLQIQWVVWGGVVAVLGLLGVKVGLDAVFRGMTQEQS